MMVVWMAFFAVAVAGTCIVQLVMYPMLRRYGVDPHSRGWWRASSRIWVSRYKEICVENGLSLRYWHLFMFCVVSAGCLALTWLSMVIVQFWHDIVEPMVAH